MHAFINRTGELYRALQDDLSRAVFWARFNADVCPSLSNLMRLSCLCKGATQEEIAQKERANEKLQTLKRAGTTHTVYIYGAGMTGRQVANGLFMEHIPFHGFCCRNAERYSHGMMGKPVISPEELCSAPENVYAIIAAQDVTGIRNVLREHDFPENNIISIFDGAGAPGQYFEFPELFPSGTAFVDGGCCDGGDSLRFANWCDGHYSKILAFEPDPICFARSEENMKSRNLNFELKRAGLSDRQSSVNFISKGDGRSFITNSTVWMRPPEVSFQETETVQTVALDDVVKDLTVGFIKMDIEGAECDALRGAKNTIQRDKPLMAICVYHRAGDMLAIMDYLQQIVPDYRFYLRHYSCTTCETVLYAFVETR